MKRKFRQVIFFVLFFAVTSANGQSPHFIKGTIVDIESHAPVSFASILLESSGQTAVSDDKGNFSLLLPANMDKGTLVVSHLGYAPCRKHFHSSSDISKFTIFLNRKQVMLTDVLVTGMNAASIVSRAFRKIGENYPQFDTFLTGIYTESFFLGEKPDSLKSQYTIAAVVEMNQPPYRGPGNSTVRIVEAKKHFEASYDSTVMWYGGLHQIQKADVVGEQMEFITPHNMKKYRYTIEDTSLYYTKPVYVIGFSPLKAGSFRGKLYISTSSFAIVKVVYEWTGEKMSHWSFLYPGILKSRKITVNYFQHNNRWNIQSVSQQAIGYYPGRKMNFRYQTEYLSTKIELNKRIEFNYADKVQLHDILSSKALPYHQQFWESYDLNKELSTMNYLQVDSLEGIKTSLLSKQQTKSHTIHKSRKNSMLSVIRKLTPSLVFPMTVSVKSTRPDIDLVYKAQGGEVILNKQISFPLNKLKWGVGFGLSYLVNPHINVSCISIDGPGYSEQSLGAGFYVPLSGRQSRPLKLVIGGAYSFSTFSNDLGDYQNKGGSVQIENKWFDRDISIDLISRRQSLKPYIEYEIEISRRRCFFINGSYFIPIRGRESLRFTSKPDGIFEYLFPKREEAAIYRHDTDSDSNTNGTLNSPKFSVSIGLKGRL